MTNGSILLADDLMSISDSDRSRSHLIRDLAAELSRRLKFSLRILYVSTKSAHLKNEQARKIKIMDENALSLLKAEMSHYPVKTKVEVVAGEPASTILKKEKRCKMVVLGAQKKRGLYKAIVGSVSEEVVRSSEVPVIILGPEAINNKFELPVDDPLRILLLTDLSSASKQAEEFAFLLASRMKAQLTICHLVGDRVLRLKEMIASRQIGDFSIRAAFQKMHTDSNKLLIGKVRQAEKRKIKADSLLVSDETKLEEIVPKKVGDAYDLIVMGTHGRKKILTAFLGSSARNLILNSPVPVIICKS